MIAYQINFLLIIKKINSDKKKVFSVSIIFEKKRIPFFQYHFELRVIKKITSLISEKNSIPKKMRKMSKTGLKFPWDPDEK